MNNTNTIKHKNTNIKIKQDIITKCAHIYGIVQGVGFRPTVSRHADCFHVTGSVCNMGPYVEVYAQGSKEQVDGFLHQVKHQPPKRAVILKMDIELVPEEEALTFDTFAIIESGKEQGEIFVSPDIAICEECKEELYNPKDRRYLHPFINCTCCGPRLTILDAMPYDRQRTSMAEFPMCPECEYEYTHSETRRYDAQPVCCNDCGPEVYLIGREERGQDAIRLTREIIRKGGIAAIKGIGGFHLCCDATNEEAVSLLRTRKHRPMKPFAVMMRNLDVVKAECEIPEDRYEVLDGHQKPIILLPGKKGNRIAKSVAPENPKIGVMLPYTPLHLLIFDDQDGTEVFDSLVMTSANTSGAPICRDDEDAIRELTGLCDVILSHNRLIRLRADDTVMDYFEGEPYMIRRSRGYAPLPFMVEHGFKGQVLAVGGELKNTFCIGKNHLFYPSPYIGDMGDIRTVRAFQESVIRMEELLETKPTMMACDMHPAYNTTSWAERFSKEEGIPLVKVQHHYAHILSCMAENNVTEPVIGISFDGTGYGTDGTIWGGECMIADYASFRRMGSITPFLQVGGDISAKEGWRIAVSLLWQIYGTEKALSFVEELGLCQEKEAKVIMMMAGRHLNAVDSTSCGRLFDAVSAILGVRKASTFEGEASTALEFRAEELSTEELCKEEFLCELEKLIPERKLIFVDKVDFSMEKEAISPVEGFDQQQDASGNPIQNRNDQQEFHLATLELIQNLIEAKLQGVDARILSYAFHVGLAREIVAAANYMREETGIGSVALSGGVYQNQLLLALSVKYLREEDFSVYTHHLLPPNDGGICVGQAVYAMNALQ